MKTIAHSFTIQLTSLGVHWIRFGPDSRHPEYLGCTKFPYAGDLQPFVRTKLSCSRWLLRILWLAVKLYCPFYFRTEAAVFEIYENKMHTKHSGFTVTSLPTTLFSTSRCMPKKFHIATHRQLLFLLPPVFKGELNPEMKLSQSIELFVTKRLPPIRSLSDVWFSSCASWKSAATPPEFGRDTPFWRHWHSDWPGEDREKVVFQTFRKFSAFSRRVVPTGFCRTILRV